jgi:hypothetical protein
LIINLSSPAAERLKPLSILTEVRGYKTGYSGRQSAKNSLREKLRSFASGDFILEL